MPGAERLSNSDTLQQLLAAQQADRRCLAAICAAPAVVFQTAGLLSGRKATSHPAFVDKLGDTRYGKPFANTTWIQIAGHTSYFACALYMLFVYNSRSVTCSAVEQRVVLDGHILTSRGPGTALEFSLALVQLLFGEAKAKEVAGPMVMFRDYTRV